MRSALFAAWLGAIIAAGPAMAADTGEETPKRGGTLTYMIPADAPPSLDGHREATYAMVHALAPFYSVLIRINPKNPSDHHRFRLRSVHRDAEADRRRQDLHVQDPRRREVPRRLAADRRRRGGELAGDHLPAAGCARARGRTSVVMVDKVEAPDPTTVVFQPEIRHQRFLPALADPFAFIYQEGDPRQGSALVREERAWAPARSSSSAYDIGQSIKGERNPDYYHKGLPYLDGFIGIFADKQSVRVDAIRADRAAIEFRGLPPSARDQRS